ncbi:MAG: BrnT family toxin [bacterium]
MEWNINKAISNYEKHRLSFEDSKPAFYDENRIHYFDEKHSQKENRYILIGRNKSGLVISISYTIRDNKIRIISCRVTSKKERNIYEAG